MCLETQLVWKPLQENLNTSVVCRICNDKSFWTSVCVFKVFLQPILQNLTSAINVFHKPQTHLTFIPNVANHVHVVRLWADFTSEGGGGVDGFITANKAASQPTAVWVTLLDPLEDMCSCSCFSREVRPSWSVKTVTIMVILSRIVFSWP